MTLGGGGTTALALAAAWTSSSPQHCYNSGVPPLSRLPVTARDAPPPGRLSLGASLLTTAPSCCASTTAAFAPAATTSLSNPPRLSSSPRCRSAPTLLNSRRAGSSSALWAQISSGASGSGSGSGGSSTELSAAAARSGESELRSTVLDEALELELDEIERELHVAAHEVHSPRLYAEAAATVLAVEGDLKSSSEDDEAAVPPLRPMKLLDAASIIAGTAVGGSFLALPSVTAPIGYVPVALGLTGSWIFLVLSAIAFVEAAGLAAESRAREAASAAAAGSVTEEDSGEGGTSIASVVRAAFGRKLGYITGVAFLLQMVAVTTVQVVKGAEILSQLLGIPYVAACLIPPHLAAWFAFGSRAEVVEGANTGLTAMLLGGFGFLALLTLSTVVRGAGSGGRLASTFARAEWGRLLPSGKTTWAVPVFVKLLAFGEAVPLVVERIVRSSKAAAGSSGAMKPSGNSASGKKKNEGRGNGSTTSDGPQNPLVRARSAILLGSSVPLLMTLTWAALSTALVDPTSGADPLVSLLSHSSKAVSVPVALISTGAIGTTLLGSFLAVGHFASDVICSKFGDDEGCTLNTMNIARAMTVLIPSLLACAGPGIYLPLLAFAGGFPTAVLYGVVPSLAALVLRKRLANDGGDAVATPELVPGGEATLVGVAALASGIVGACSVLAFKALGKAASAGATLAAGG